MGAEFIPAPAPKFVWQSLLWSADTLNCEHLHNPASYPKVPHSNEFTFACYQPITAFPAKSSLERGVLFISDFLTGAISGSFATDICLRRADSNHQSTLLVIGLHSGERF